VTVWVGVAVSVTVGVAVGVWRRCRPLEWLLPLV